MSQSQAKIAEEDIGVYKHFYSENISSELSQLQDFKPEHNSNSNWKLSNVEKKTLYFNWIKGTIKNVIKIEEYYQQKLKN